MIITNPIIGHAYSRALARLPQCELVGDLRFPNGKLLWPTFYDHASQELRAVVHYERIAKRGDVWLMTTEKGVPKWHLDRIPLEWADGEIHTLWVTFVAKLAPFQPIRLSKANTPEAYRYFSRSQHEAGLDWQHPDWVHPYDKVSKDAFILRLLQSEAFETDLELGPLYEDEKRVMQNGYSDTIRTQETTT